MLKVGKAKMTYDRQAMLDRIRMELPLGCAHLIQNDTLGVIHDLVAKETEARLAAENKSDIKEEFYTP